jgi:hypothetical protein
MPQSPRWLLSHGHMDEGLKVIAALAGTSMDHPRALQQRAYIMESINATRQAKASAKDMLVGGKKQNLRRMVIGASSQVHQQLGGCNAVIYYATILFEEQIFEGQSNSRDLSLILGGVLAIVYALFALLSFVIVERAGRRPLFLIGTAGQAVAMYITWACLLAGSKSAAKGAAFGLYFFIAFFVSLTATTLQADRERALNTPCHLYREPPFCLCPGCTRPSSTPNPSELRPTPFRRCATGCSTSWSYRSCPL